MPLLCRRGAWCPLTHATNDHRRMRQVRSHGARPEEAPDVDPDREAQRVGCGSSVPARVALLCPADGLGLGQDARTALERRPAPAVDLARRDELTRLRPGSDV